MGQNQNGTPVCDLLATLNPGTPVNEVFVNGESEPADYFASVDLNTNLAYFVQEDDDLLIADCHKIDMIEIET
ncbi:hypothetical protein ABID56_000345 [Alkalibacillus flavidus]|uniref:Uncharacterized protein n=1 Tax=Alkalibacillus flavidus TaxID=546021 RepID=A0ABV2KRQ4_9BACI